MPNIAPFCCCDVATCCEPWKDGWSCGSTFMFTVDWSDVYYERDSATCDPKYPSVGSCGAVDCDLCQQEINAGAPDPHCRYWSLDHPKVGVMEFKFKICANDTGISSAPYHMTIADGLDPLCECNAEVECDCKTLIGVDCCSPFDSFTLLKWCGDDCIGNAAESHTGSNDILKLVDGSGSYTNDSLVITSTSGAITAKVTLCNRYVSPGDAALFPDNKDFFPTLPSNLSSCAFVQRRDLQVGGCQTRIDWVHINVKRGRNSYDYYCYGTAEKYAEWANANIPNIVVTGNKFWFGLRLPASAISPTLDEDGGCVYEPTRYCEHVQSEYRLNSTTLTDEFMPDNSDDWILQSTTSTEIKWKCRAAYWYKPKLTVGAANRYGGTNELLTTTSNCENCGSTWSLAGTCTQSGNCLNVVPPATTYTQCGLFNCLDPFGQNLCDPIIGCCNAYDCTRTSPCIFGGPAGTVGAVFQADNYIPSLYNQNLLGWTSWTLVSNFITQNGLPNGYCKPVTIQGGGYPT
jgi:hypothetical protein